MPKPIGAAGQGAPNANPMFRTLKIASSGLSAQRLRMDTIATNIANAETTRTEGGGPYRRRVVEMQAADARGFGQVLAAAANGAPAGAPAGVSTTAGATPTDEPIEPGTAASDHGGVQVTAINEDPTEGPLVYDPSHPDANIDGYVRYPNVRVTDEIVDLMDAKRLFEANATVFQTAKAMLRRAIDI